MATQLAEPEVIPDTGQDTNQAQSKTAEETAYLRGWRPKEEYTGSSEWVDAAAFLDRADQNLGLSKAERKQLNKRIEILESMLKKVQRSEMNAHANALADIQAKMENAVVTGDVAAFKALDKKADDLRKDMAQDTPKADQSKEAVRAFADWRDDNEWYDLGGLASATETERKQRAYFDRMVEGNMDKAAEMKPAEFIAYIGDLVEAKYPVGKAARPRGVESVAGVTRTSSARSGAQTYANLPSEAKAQADRFHTSGVYKGTLAEAREKYAKGFDWSSLK